MSRALPCGAFILCLLSLACERESVPTALAGVRAAEDVPQYSAWSAPAHLGAIVNSSAADIELAISKDGLSLFFASNRPGGFGRQDIWVAQRPRHDEAWGAPRNLGPAINSDADDRMPMISHDGHDLYFASDRPGGYGLTDIYVARRRHTHDDFTWGVAENLGPGVNTAATENLPYFFGGEDPPTLYFNSARFGQTDIFASERGSGGVFGEAALVAELSSSARDAGVAIRHDGLELILASDRAGSLGQFDLWTSTRSSVLEPWSAPVNLGPIVNSSGDEGRLALSWDGLSLYIGAVRPGGLGAQDIWLSTRERIRE